MFAFVCSDAIAPNARMVVLRTTRIAHTYTHYDQLTTRVTRMLVSLPFSCCYILLDTECLERNSGQVALVTPDRRPEKRTTDPAC